VKEVHRRCGGRLNILGFGFAFRAGLDSRLALVSYSRFALVEVSRFALVEVSRFALMKVSLATSRAGACFHGSRASDSGLRPESEGGGEVLPVDAGVVRSAAS
jgi:hypothetical protein